MLKDDLSEEELKELEELAEVKRRVGAERDALSIEDLQKRDDEVRQKLANFLGKPVIAVNPDTREERVIFPKN